MSFAQKKDELCLELAFTQQLCEVLNTPRALTVSLLLKYGEYDQYMDLPFEETQYLDWDSDKFSGDYLITGLLRKSTYIPLGVDTKQVATTDFFESERRCQLSAEQLNLHPVLLHELSREVNRILGPLNQRALQYIEDHFGFGPGSTTRIKRITDAALKYSGSPHMTQDLYPFFKSIVGDLWHESAKSPKIVRGNRFTTVPKDARKDRGICIEPDLNIYVQKGIGAYFRRQLKRNGINLDSQTTNQIFAQAAYTNGYSTIDLKSASDSISLKLIYEVFPPDWFKLIEMSRSPYTTINNVDVRLQKVSSMGNGFTFELESLLFLALCRVTVPKDRHDEICVYGDDIIVPREYANDVVSALEAIGFTVNTSKSFLAGNFFESCGSHYFCGRDVQPFYLRGACGDKIPYALHIANQLRLYANRVCGGFGCDIRFKKLWTWLIARVPTYWRSCRVPKHFGDTGVISDVTEVNRWRPGRPCVHIGFQPRVFFFRGIGLQLARYKQIRGYSSVNYDKQPLVGWKDRLIESLRDFDDGSPPAGNAVIKKCEEMKPVKRSTILFEWTGQLFWW